MSLWLLRHGEAESFSASDALRPLTVRGRQEASRVAINLKHQPLELILHSPYVRAKQTADIISDVLDNRIKMHELEDITPDNDPKHVIKLLSDYTERHILVVSHQPLLGKLVSLLTEGTTQAQHPFKTAELVVLDGEFICMAGLALRKSFTGSA